MAKSTWSLISLLIAAMLAACSSASGLVPLTPGPPTDAMGAIDAGRGTLVLRIRVPKEKARRPSRPRYISAATKGMTMAFKGPSTFTQAIKLTPSDPRCSGSPLTCKIVIVLKAGHYSAKVKTYDKAPVNGKIPIGAKLLSTAHNVAFTITRGIANDIHIILDGVPASISVGGFPSASAGTGFLNKPFSVTVRDAEGYLIVGNYSTPVALTDSDTSGATAIGTSGSDDPPVHELLSSSDTAAISYTGRAITAITIGASAGAVRAHGVFAVLLPVYAADFFSNAVNELPPDCFVSSCVMTLGGGFNSPDGVAVDTSGNVFVGDGGNNAVKEIPLGCLAAICVVTLGGGFNFPGGVAVDESGNVFVADSNNSMVKKIPRGCVTSGCVITIGGGFTLPIGVALDRFGNLFVADTGDKTVKRVPPGCATAGCVTTLSGEFSVPYGVAVDSSGNVFVADTGNSAVYKIPRGCVAAGCIEAIGGGFNAPNGAAVDGLGNVFVTDFVKGMVYEVPPGCFSAGCVTTIGGGFETPFGDAVL